MRPGHEGGTGGQRRGVEGQVELLSGTVAGLVWKG